jgi:alcohol dehydrogenase (cytochrome c)
MRLGFAVAVAIGIAGMLRAAPQEPRTNPVAGQPEAIAEGKALFRNECLYCHGPDGKGGGRGPDLTASRLVQGGSDADLYRTVSEGVPGSEMPGSGMRPDEVWNVVAYLRSLGAQPRAPLRGDARAGERVFFEESTCASCHRVNGSGGRLGPDLSRIGAARTPAALVENIRRPGKDVTRGYETVAVVAKNGERTIGVRKNEDTFSVQLMDVQEKLHLLSKQDLREVSYPGGSLMPDFTEEMLAEAKLQDLIAYLDTLRAPAAPSAASADAADNDVAVPAERLVKASTEPANWLTYSGDYAGRRYSGLKEITPTNVHQLAPRWVFQTGRPGALQVTPLVVDGVMYVSGPGNVVWALDARTGRTLWRYQRTLPSKLALCCGPINRGVAVLGDRVFLATLDGHVVALDAKTGAVEWDAEAGDHQKAYSFTGAPLAVKDKILVGVAGGEYGVRGFIDAYDAASGKRAWRFYTIPGPGEPGHDSWSGDSWKSGGAPAWLTGTFDPALNLVYWGVGNPGPDLSGENRKGDNLYSDSVVALDADTGRLKWHYQFTPHDVHDWDATEIPVLLDAAVNGTPRKLLVMANRNAFYYVLDRATGALLQAKAFAKQTWAKEIGKAGRPVVLPGTDPTPAGNNVCPGLGGATNWMSPSHSPQTGLFYVTVREQCDTYYTAPQAYREGRIYFGSTFHGVPGEEPWGALRALDPATGALKWEFKTFRPSMSGTLATAGGLVFTGDADGYLMAVDARTGRLAWKMNAGGALSASPISYAVDGRQYVAAAAGGALFSFALPDAPEPARPPASAASR